MADDLPRIAVWDPDEVSIVVARGVQARDALREISDILTIDLGATASRGGLLVCFCGMRVELPRELAPRAPSPCAVG
ncbi:hypothetical protein [Streptomyces sp. NPDC005799]|uniref:hypothetical protein n=1 Tax=Streptomyces sp. NPDC005799 TaxID=3154678 RepID=UPI0033E2BD3D